MSGIGEADISACNAMARETERGPWAPIRLEHGRFYTPGALEIRRPRSWMMAPLDMIRRTMEAQGTMPITLKAPEP